MNYHKIFATFILAAFCAVLGCGVDPPSVRKTPPTRHTVQRMVAAEAVVRRPIQFLEDYRQAADISANEFKPLMMFFTLPHCANSQKMLETTFGDEEIQKLSQRFVCVRIDGSKETAFCKTQDIHNFPTLLFLTPQRQELQRLSGNLSPDQLALQMHVMIQSTAVKIGLVVRQ